MCNYAMYKEIERERRRMERREGEVERNWGVEGGAEAEKLGGYEHKKKGVLCVSIVHSQEKTVIKKR